MFLFSFFIFFKINFYWSIVALQCVTFYSKVNPPYMCGKSQAVLVVKNLPINAQDVRDSDSIPGSGRSPGDRDDNLLRYSSVGNPTDKRSLMGYSP